MTSSNISSRKVFVGGLHTSCQDHELVELFEKFGKVDKAYVARTEGGKKSRGFGFVIFYHKEDADKILLQKNLILKGREIRIKRIEPESAKDYKIKKDSQLKSRRMNNNKIQSKDQRQTSQSNIFMDNKPKSSPCVFNSKNQLSCEGQYSNMLDITLRNHTKDFIASYDLAEENQPDHITHKKYGVEAWPELNGSPLPIQVETLEEKEHQLRSLFEQSQPPMEDVVRTVILRSRSTDHRPCKKVLLDTKFQTRSLYSRRLRGIAQ